MNKRLDNWKRRIQNKWEVLLGRRNPMTPPANMVHINAGDSEAIGRKFLSYFVEIGGLQPTHHVLDVGSGFGRMAVPLTRYLTPKARYEGLEIIGKGVDWCSAEITSRHPNFRFQKIDVLNKRYNPGGAVKASEYLFPFEAESFDFIFLTSVFTHMLPADTDHYLAEIERVLKPGGRCLITWFILNGPSQKEIAEGKSQYALGHTYENCRIETPEDPEYVVAYPEADVERAYEKHRLEIVSMHYGKWSGRPDHLDFQDIVVAVKTS